MLKGYYLTYPVQRLRNQSGIRKKIDGQIKAFNESGVHCEEIQLHASGTKLSDKIVKNIQWLPFVNVWPYWEYIEQFDNADFLYLRRPSAMSKAMIKTLKKVKFCNPNVTIIMEIPTYPYDLEMKGVKKLILHKDKCNRNNLLGCVDFISLPSLGTENKEIFGIPVINYHNGCDFSSIQKKVPDGHKDIINILCVANFQPSHGYERIIEGLNDYYANGGERNIKLHMVGVGTEEELYRTLTEKYKLTDRVIFYGFKNGKDLDDIFDTADIAVSALGTYKINNNKISCIKTGEYMAKGTPVLFAGDAEDVPDKCKEFVYVVKSEEKAIDISDVVNFIDNLKNNYSNEELAYIIRTEGQLHYDMKEAIRPIIDVILEK